MNKQDKKEKKVFAVKRVGGKSLKYGTYATILTAVVLAVVILLNVAIGMVENNWGLTIDLTATNVTDFSDSTYAVLDGVAQDVKIYSIYSPSTSSTLRVQVEDVLNKYSARNKLITLENIDPVTEPTRVTQYFDATQSVAEGSLVVTNGDGSRVKTILKSDYYYNYTSQYTNTTSTYFDIESKLTSALLYVTSEDTPRIFYLSGHGELAAESMTILTGTLEQTNYDIATLDLSNNTNNVTLESGDVLVVVDPARDLSDDEYKTVSEWLANGGRLLFNMGCEIDQTNLKNFNKLLDYYQLGFDDGYILEDNAASTAWNTYPYYLVPTMDAEHAITDDMVTGNLTVMIPYARPIKTVTFPESGLQYSTVLASSAKSTVLNGEEKSAAASYPVAMTMLKQTDYDDPTKDVRIMLMGSTYVFADTYLWYYTNNGYFVQYAFDWLVNRTTDVSIMPKMVASTTLAIPDASTAWLLAALVVIVIPVIVLVVGIVVWVRRRRL